MTTGGWVEVNGTDPEYALVYAPYFGILVSRRVGPATNRMYHADGARNLPRDAQRLSKLVAFPVPQDVLDDLHASREPMARFARSANLAYFTLHGSMASQEAYEAATAAALRELDDGPQ